MNQEHIKHRHAQNKPGKSQIADVYKRAHDVHIYEPGLKVVQRYKKYLEIKKKNGNPHFSLDEKEGHRKNDPVKHPSDKDQVY